VLPDSSASAGVSSDVSVDASTTGAATILDTPPAVATLVRLRTSTFEADPRMAEKIKELGYTRITAQNAFWWQQR